MLTKVFLLPQSSYVNNYMIHNHTNNWVFFVVVVAVVFGFLSIHVKFRLRNLGSCSLNADAVGFRTRLLKWRTSHVLPHCQSIAVGFRMNVKEEPSWVFWSLEMNKLLSFTTNSRLQDEKTNKLLTSQGNSLFYLWS